MTAALGRVTCAGADRDRPTIGDLSSAVKGELETINWFCDKDIETLRGSIGTMTVTVLNNTVFLNTDLSKYFSRIATLVVVIIINRRQTIRITNKINKLVSSSFINL